MFKPFLGCYVFLSKCLGLKQTCQNLKPNYNTPKPKNNAKNLNISPEGYWFSDGSNFYLKSIDEDLLIDDRYEIRSFSFESDKFIAGLSSGILFINKIAEGDYNNLGDISTLADPNVVENLISKNQ